MMWTRLGLLATTLLLAGAVPARAEWQIKPFIGIGFKGTTTFVDSELAAGKVHPFLGVSGTLIGEVLGVEADLGHASGFFQQSEGTHKVTRSNVTTLTGNLTLALPRHIAEYTLRPYFVGGAGLMHVSADNFVTTFTFSDNVPAMDVGGGVTGFLSKRIGLSWDIRRFRTIQAKTGTLLTADGQLSFWRANMALAMRY